MRRRRTALTHTDDRGAARMVDVGGKSPTRREATASARVCIGAQALGLITAGELPKGDAFAVARIAGIAAAKQTASLIPLCHPLGIEAVTVDLSPAPPDSVVITATVRITGKTGVEMEALTAVSVAGLALYDMCKSVSRDIVIGPIRLERKEGGRSGIYDRRTTGPARRAKRSPKG
jgi:cyclic pyranopterin monophosphate synthase